MQIRSGCWRTLLTATRRATERERVKVREGIPIGNLTSQLFANVYMNEFDQFIKHTLRVKWYARYTDDFVIVSESRAYLESLVPKVEDFLKNRLSLSLHPIKVSIRTYRQGADFLGYVALPNHLVLRNSTQRRIYRKMRERVRRFKVGTISEGALFSSLNSYLGVLSHADAYEVREDLMNHFWLDELIG